MSHQLSERERQSGQPTESSSSCNDLVFEVFIYGLDSEEADEVSNTLRFFVPKKIDLGILSKVPESFFNSIRHQYDGFLVARWVNSLRTSKDSVILGVMDVDAYVDPLNFIFGIALPELNVAIVYVTRLRVGVPRKEFLSRVRKEVIHEVGHVFGLRHCRNKSCVMSFSNSLIDVDKKDFRMCTAHYTELKNRLSCVSRELLLRI